RSIASGDAGGTIRQWETRTGRLTGQFARKGGPAGTLTYLDDGKALAIGATVVDAMSGERLRSLQTAVVGGYQVTALSPDGALQAIGTSRGAIALVDPSTGKSRGVLEGRGRAIGAVDVARNRQSVSWSFAELRRPVEANRTVSWQLTLPHKTWFGLFDQPLGEPQRTAARETSSPSPTGMRFATGTFGPKPFASPPKGAVVARARSAGAPALSVTGSTDQTLRFLTGETDDLIATLLPTLAGAYALWTPEGFVADAKPRGIDLGWLVSDKPHAQPVYVPVSRVPSAVRRSLISDALRRAKPAEVTADMRSRLQNDIEAAAGDLKSKHTAGN
ncbi:MAG: hypothetical protein AAFO62_05270, partial [Pseudomonadota bacterium]